MLITIGYTSFTLTIGSPLPKCFPVVFPSLIHKKLNSIEEPSVMDWSVQ